MKNLLLLLILALTALPLQAQPSNAPPPEVDIMAQKFNGMREVQASIDEYEAQIEEAQAARAIAPGEASKREADERIEAATKQRRLLQQTLEELSVGSEVDRALFEGGEEEEFDLQKELERLIEPVLKEFKETTAESRNIKEKEVALVGIKDRSRAAKLAVRNIERLLAADPPDDVASLLRIEKAEWTTRRDAAQAQERSLNLQLDEHNKTKKSFLQTSRNYLSHFMRTRGLNLLLGILAFCLVFFGLRGFYALYRRARPLGEFRSFASRLGALIYHIFTVLAAVGAVMLVFNLTGDWFLLTLSMFFLIGVGWVSIKTLPRTFEQVKLMLNFGAVRENELIMFDGIPWQVADLGLSATLVNPRLDGGEQILPIRELVGLASRRPAPAERWFPCERDEWVRLSDGTLGQVRVQTPNHVELVRLGGSHVTVTTSQFYALSPENLSDGFRIQTSFGLDYRHQDEAASAIPQKMEAALRAGLLELVSEDELLDITAELQGAGSSSLDFAIIAVFAGSTADRYENLERALPRILIDTCNREDWKIPFQQLTLHQAG